MNEHKDIEKVKHIVKVSDDDKKVLFKLKFINKGKPSKKAFFIGYIFLDKNNNVILSDDYKNLSKEKKCYYEYVAAGENKEEEVEKELTILKGTKRVIINCYKRSVDAAITVISSDTELIKIDLDNNLTFPLDLSDYQETFAVEELSKYELKLSIDSIPDTKSLIAIKQCDTYGNELLPSSQFPISVEHGSYINIINEGKIINSINIKTAKNCKYLKFSGVARDNTGAVFLNSTPQLFYIGKIDKFNINKLYEKIDKLGEKDRCLVIVTGAPSIDEGQRLLRSSRLALYMSQNGWKVFYFPLNPTDNTFVNDNLAQVSPSYKTSIIQKLLSRSGKNNCFVCSSFADIESMAIVDMANSQDWQTCYELHDDMEEFNRVGSSRWYNPILEKRLAQNCSILIATTPRLASRLKDMTGRNNIYLEPNGAPEELIEYAAASRSEGAAQYRLNFKKIGCISHLTNLWFDWDLILKFAAANWDVRIDIVGLGMPKGIRLPFNIEYYGYKPLIECVEIAKEWSAGLIPFAPSRLVRAISPNKAYDYLAMGLRIISPPMGEVAEMPLASIYNNYDEFSKCVRKSFKPVTVEEYEEVNKFLAKNTWDERFKTINKILMKEIK